MLKINWEAFSSSEGACCHLKLAVAVNTTPNPGKIKYAICFTLLWNVQALREQWYNLSFTAWSEFVSPSLIAESLETCFGWPL